MTSAALGSGLGFQYQVWFSSCWGGLTSSRKLLVSTKVCVSLCTPLVSTPCWSLWYRGFRVRDKAFPDQIQLKSSGSCVQRVWFSAKGLTSKGQMGNFPINYICIYRKILSLIVYMFLSVWRHAHEYRSPQRPVALKLEFYMVLSGLTWMDTGKQTWVLWKNMYVLKHWASSLACCLTLPTNRGSTVDKCWLLL